MVIIIALYGLTFFIVLAIIDNLVSDEFQKLYNSLYTFTEFTFFTAILWLNVKGKFAKKIFGITYAAFILFQILYNFSPYFVADKLDAVPVGIETLFVFVYIFLFFYEYFKNVFTEYVYNYYCFWIAIGIMIYMSGSFFLYLLANDISQQQLDSFWHFTYVGETIKNILFAVAIVIHAKSKLKEKISNQNIPYLDFN